MRPSAGSRPPMSKPRWETYAPSPTGGFTADKLADKPVASGQWSVASGQRSAAGSQRWAAEFWLPGVDLAVVEGFGDWRLVIEATPACLVESRKAQRLPLVSDH